MKRTDLLPSILVAAAGLALLPGAADARRPVFSLVDNRPLAHLQRRGGLYVDAGAAGMAKYVHFGRQSGWKLRLVEDKRRVALAQAQATLVVPLTAAQAGARAIHLGLKAPASTVRVTVAGKASAAIPLKAGWQVVTVPLEAALASKAGEVTIKLGFANSATFAGQRAAAAVEFVQIGGTAPTAADPPSLASAAGLTLGPQAGVAWYGYVPEGGALVATGTAGPCKVTVHVDAHGAAPLDAEVRLDGTPADLAAVAGRFGRIELAAAGPGCEAVTLTRADLHAAGDVVAQPATGKPPKHVVIWLTDDTRADKFKLYNPKSRVLTPVFDELAKTSTLFKVAYTQGNESRVSHASLWTSMYPSVHNLISDKAKLKPEFVTLAEAVKPSGRYTAGVMANGYIDKFWGFGDGWDHLENHIHDGGGLKGLELVASAKKVLDCLGGKPSFLYIGSIDAHVSWRQHEPWTSQYDSKEPYTGPFVKACLDPQLDRIVAGQLKVTERDKVRIIALYDSDISYNDKAMGELIDDLKKRGAWDDTLFIMTSDHGEEFWDHGRIGHGQSLRQELVHVPFLVRYPPYFPGGKVVEEGVDVMDVLPTLTDALGVATPDAVQGQSVAPLAQGIGAGYPRPTISSQYELAHTMRLGRYKIWVGGSGDLRLTDASTDLHEDHDLVASHPIERRALTDALGTWMAYRNQWKKRRWGVSSNLLPAFATDMEK